MYKVIPVLHDNAPVEKAKVRTNIHRPYPQQDEHPYIYLSQIDGKSLFLKHQAYKADTDS